MGYITSLFKAAQRNGLDKNISFDDWLLFDDIMMKRIIELRNDENGKRILNIPINNLTKQDVDYIINFR